MKLFSKGKLVSFVIITIIIGIVLAIGLFFLAFQLFTPKKSTDLNKIGVVEIVNIVGTEVKEFKNNAGYQTNATIFESNNSNEKSTNNWRLTALSYLLSLQSFSDLNQTDNQPNIYFLDSVTGDYLKSFNSNGFKVEQVDLTLVSGNNIFFIQESLPLFTDPKRLYLDLYLASVKTKLFRSLPQSDLKTQQKNYDLNNTVLIQKYNQLLATSEPESLPTSTTNIADRFNEDLTKVILNQEPGLSKTQTEFITTNFPNFITQTNLEDSLGLSSQQLLAKLTEKFDLKSAGLKFTDWSNTTLFKDSEIKSNPNATQYFSNVSQQNLTGINDELVNQGWAAVSEPENYQHPTFKVKIQKYTYSKTHPLGTQYLVIFTMDTADIGNDCLTLVSDGQYCTDKSIYKNSGYYLEILPGFANI